MTRPSLRPFAFGVALAGAATAPALVVRLAGLQPAPIVAVALFGASILGAGFLLSWGAEAAEAHVAQGVALAGLALVTVLPEYAVDIYYTLRAGADPGSDFVQFAAANMTGANRLLIGVGWPLIAILYWVRSRRSVVPLQPANAAEISFLALASLYSFAIVAKGQIEIIDTVVLAAIFGGYLWRLSRLPKEADEEDGDVEVGPAAALRVLPKRRQYALIAVLTIVAAIVIVLAAEPFAESLLAAGTQLGINRFFLVQWVAPLAGEAPEIVITVLFVLALRPAAALGALISDKINQWTLLVGFIPLFYSLARGGLHPFPLDARQHEEFFLTAAQSLFAVALLLRLRLHLLGAAALFGLFTVQFTLAFVNQADEFNTITVLTTLGWVYIALAVMLVLRDWRLLVEHARFGLLNRS
ncbi:MAG: sodium:proton exchanger [Chloroflexi bacterium]|nr:sodium:proton exchanger [Chloroflexota bacterium]